MYLFQARGKQEAQARKLFSEQGGLIVSCARDSLPYELFDDYKLFLFGCFQFDESCDVALS